MITDPKNASHEKEMDEQYTTFSKTHQPIIGIPVPVQQGNQGPLLLADAVGAWAIERMLGRVFLIPLWPFPTHKQVYQSLWSLMQSMDGLLLPAGLQETNWYAQWKEGERPPEPQAWPIFWEIALAQLATYVGMPILAIADGAEKWNVALSGKGVERVTDLSQSAPTTPDSWDRRAIRVRAQSKLATYLQPALNGQDGEQTPWELAFMPHQGVEKLASGLRSCAQLEDTSVAAFERKDTAFGLGILGRLDWGLDQSYGMTLFDAFLNACRSFDYIRQQQNGWESSRDTICEAVYERVTLGQSLLSTPQNAYGEKPQRPRSLSVPLTSPSSSSNESVRKQKRLRQRSHTPTKQDLNAVRWKRLKSGVK